MEAGAAPGEAQPRPSIWLTLGRILSLAGALVVLVAFFAALPYLVETVMSLVVDAPSRLLPRRAFIGACLVVIVGAAIVLVARIGRRRPTHGLAAALVTFVAIRVLVDVAIDGPLVSDWLFYEQLARASLQGAPPISDVPMGYPYLLGATTAILGIGSMAAAEALNLALALLMAVLLAAWVEILADRRTAAIAVLILALCPSQILYGVIVGTEVTYATATIALALLATLIVRRLRTMGSDRIVLGLAAVAGLVLGLSAYVKATSLAIAPLFILLPILATGRPRASAPAVLTMLIAASLALVPAIAANRVLLDRWSPSTSLYLGWQLYVGTNIASEGRYDEADVDTLDAAVPGSGLGEVAERWSRGDFDPTILTAAAKRDEVALDLALERIADAGPRLLAILPIKVLNAWGPADDAVSWTLARGPNADRAVRPIVDVAAQAWWVLALGFALAGLYRRSLGTRDAMLVSAAFIVALAIGLLVLESKGRYHEPVVPLVACLAALGVAGFGADVGPRPGRPTPA